jgi:Recombination directionality factor-like
LKVKPIADMGRPPEQGRIRYGIKTTSASGKTIPRSISKFRFTSSDVTALDQIAKLYGGQVRPWENGQSEVVSGSEEIPIVLPPNPLGDGPVYEMWKSSACIRRCDGITAWVPANTQDGAELLEVPCVCEEKQVLDCKPTTRLSVILPEVRFGGVWRLDCKGWHGTNELPAMVNTVQQLQGQGLSRAYLALEKRKKGSKQWVVPVIRLGATPNQLLLAKEAGVLEANTQPKEIVSGLAEEVWVGEIPAAIENPYG